MIRRWLSTGGRGGVVLGVALVELALAWLLSLAATTPLLAPLARHPRGAFAIYGEGGRALGELLVAQASGLAGTAMTIGVVVLLYAVAWMLLGGMFPVLGASAGVRWHRAAAESLRRTPTLLGLAAMAGVGLGLGGVASFFANDWAAREAARRLDVRAVSLLGLAGWAPALVVAGLVALWHDVARSHAMARGRTAGQAAGSAARQMLREPLATVATGALFGLAGWSYLGLAALLAGPLEWRRSTVAAVALVAARQLAVLGRVHARMKWFVWLGGRLPARTEPAER